MEKNAIIRESRGSQSWLALISQKIFNSLLDKPRVWSSLWICHCQFVWRVKGNQNHSLASGRNTWAAWSAIAMVWKPWEELGCPPLGHWRLFRLCFFLFPVCFLSRGVKCRAAKRTEPMSGFFFFFLVALPAFLSPSSFCPFSSYSL